MIEIKDYQEKAILKLKEQINELLNRESRETLVFKSPTGSGKTLMVAEFIKRIVDRRDDGKQIAFIWAAPRQLHTQSKEKLDKYYSTTRAIECKFFEDLTNEEIAQIMDKSEGAIRVIQHRAIIRLQELAKNNKV